MNKEDEENDDKHVKHNSKWHQKVSGDFYKLPIKIPKKSKKDKLILKQLSKIDELTPKQKIKKEKLLIKCSPSRLVDLELQGYWKPKSLSGSRDIPLILEDIQEALLNYKNNYEELKPKKKRLDVWWSIRKLGEKVLGEEKEIAPHQLRSAYLSILGSSPEMTLNKLIALSGHKHYSSIEPYMSKERGEAIKVANKISKDLFR